MVLKNAIEVELKTKQQNALKNSNETIANVGATEGTSPNSSGNDTTTPQDSDADLFADDCDEMNNLTISKEPETREEKIAGLPVQKLLDVADEIDWKSVSDELMRSELNVKKHWNRVVRPVVSARALGVYLFFNFRNFEFKFRLSNI